MALAEGQPQHEVHVIVPFYNCKDWIDRCLNSIAMQNDRPRVFVIDDASTDGSSLIAEKLCAQHKFWYYRSKTNRKCPYNIWWGVKESSAKPQDVIFLLDGDDYLPHGNVVHRIKEVYDQASTWMTYGQYMSDPPDYGCTPAIPVPPWAVAARGYRAVNTTFFNHPITFRRFLFDAIPEDAFQDENGDWFRVGYDQLLMYPLLELASPEDNVPHWMFLNEILYVYNSANPLSDWRVNRDEGIRVTKAVQRPALPSLQLTDQEAHDWLGALSRNQR